MNETPETDSYSNARRQMVERDLISRNIINPEVLRAMARVPRHRFVENSQVDEAYADRALSIGRGQTISQPYIVAFAAQALKIEPGDQVLEVGTGSGYSAAVLAELGATVVSLERDKTLAWMARERLAALGYQRVEVIEGDGSIGWKDQAPFAAISVAAAAPEIPGALVEQLQVGGRLVVPIGGRYSGQRLIRVLRTDAGTRVDDLLGVAFVPLIGNSGWPEAER